MNSDMNLEQFDAAFEAAETKKSGMDTNAELPDGKFIMTIVDAKVFESKDNRYFFKVDLRVEQDAEHQGKQVSKLYGLDTPDRFGFLKTDLFRMGIAIQKVSQLPSMLEKIKGVELNCAIKHKDQYQNVYINGQTKSMEHDGKPSDGVPF